MSISFAPIALSDVDSYRACIDAVARERNFLAITQAPPPHQLTQLIRSSLEDDSVLIVARDQQRVVGWAQIQRGQGAVVAHRGDLGMGVSPAYRGRGLGKQLLLSCIGAAGAKGIACIELEVRADNRCALNLYRSLGFNMDSIVRDAMLIDGVFHNAFRMSLKLPV
ncbi:GNAT family N-acetyltransferase [Paucibacter sp. Y2R2-4]|uniref:GNAT family N-acetyltransferase n=1 Tax=Paucibacter sp. Y2R2-4 TaxID=2893553 RepID=UPI0021E4B86C|nr:GNAT family N-acetyltransferase [Paucibacter sp. Y2R2-4]MCV2349489.1 GNAT family N-acetyltransferase [Paucibacter sp. Y2R2-4]